MCVSSLVIIFRELKKPVPELKLGKTLSQSFFEKVFPARHMIFIFVLIAYMFLLEPLGFIVASFLYLVAASLVLGERRYVHMIVSNVLTSWPSSISSSRPPSRWCCPKGFSKGCSDERRVDESLLFRDEFP